MKTGDVAHTSYTVCGSASSFMVRLVWLYDTIVNDTSVRPSTRISERCDLWLYIYIHLSPSGSIDYYSISIRCTCCRSRHHRVSYRYGLGCVSVLMSISFNLHTWYTFSRGMTIMSVAAVDHQRHIGWTMAIAASEPHRNTMYPALGHDAPSYSQSDMMLFLTLNRSDSRGLCLIRIEDNYTCLWAPIFDAILEVTRSAHCWWPIEFFCRVIIVLLRQRLSHVCNSCVPVNRQLLLPCVLQRQWFGQTQLNKASKIARNRSRVIFSRWSTNHSRNDSSGTCWGHHVYLLILLVSIPGTFLRVLYNIHHIVFARELEGK